MIFHRLLVLALLVLAGFALARAQEVAIPDPGLNAMIHATLQKPPGPLTQQDLLTLTNLSAYTQNITNLQGLETARNLTTLLLGDNHITDRSFPDVLTNLTRLSVLDLSENPITNLTLPSGLTNLALIHLENGRLAHLNLAAGLTRLTNLSLGFNRLRSLTLPADMTNLIVLSAYQNHLTNVTLLPKLANLSWIDIGGNELRNFSLPAGLGKLSVLIAAGNQLTNFTVPAGATNLNVLRLNDNQLTSLTVLEGLNHLTQIELGGNQLANLTLSAGLTSLAILNVTGNSLTNITLPPEVQQLVGLFLGGNPLTTFVLSEPLAAAGMASVVDSLRNQDIPVFTYPLTAQVSRPAVFAGAFKFAITGPPGVYAVLGSTNLVDWSAVGVTANPLGSVNFREASTNPAPQKFYRARLLGPPANMVFIPPSTFTLGTPPGEVNRQSDEGPQTTVTLTRGFWIGKYEVTQREYLSVTGVNPSGFSGDLDRPVESVSWLDATNYCARLTEQELAAGRLAPGSRYRLPTEAEWECAARAGTATRFSYGDDPGFANLADNAWYWFNSGFGTHSVGQKAPNPWGIYDMAGNVWEWTLDWYGPYPSGSVTDPQGPASNAQGVRVIRGGAWDAGEADCRSGRRLTEGVSPFIHDFNLGFRVVLVTGP